MVATSSFAALIGSWPRDGKKTSIRSFATDLGVPYLNAQMMRHRSSVASEYWPQLVAAARKRRVEGVTFELLAELQSKRRRIKLRPGRRTETCVAA